MTPERHLNPTGDEPAAIPPRNEVERDKVAVALDRVRFLREGAVLDPGFLQSFAHLLERRIGIRKAETRTTIRSTSPVRLILGRPKPPSKSA